MSGSLRIVGRQQDLLPHDHIDLIFGRHILRFNDPRRFGSMHYHEGDVLDHKLLCELGPEPLSNLFDGEYLYRASRKRQGSIKTFLMNSRVVVGVGNIYANEALFRARIRPSRAAGRVSANRYEHLAEAIKAVLAEAIEVGGTTLRNYVGSNGEPGYFSLELAVYGRAGEPCVACERNLVGTVLGQRQTVYCPSCQRY